jgi:hypothetical protein
MNETRNCPVCLETHSKGQPVKIALDQFFHVSCFMYVFWRLAILMQTIPKTTL